MGYQFEPFELSPLNQTGTQALSLLHTEVTEADYVAPAVLSKELQDYQERLADAQRDHYALTSKGRVLGALALEHGIMDDNNVYRFTPETRVFMLAVTPELQRAKKGIGRLLMGQAAELALENGDPLIHLCSLQSAIGFYEKLGFQEGNDPDYLYAPARTVLELCSA